MLCSYCKSEIEDDVLKCRHCGEWISRETLPAEVKKSKKNATGAYYAVIIPFLIIVASFLSSRAEHVPSSSNTPTAIQAKDQVIDELAPKYCESHKQTVVRLSDSLLKEGWIGNSGPEGFTSEQCTQILSRLYDIDSNKKNLQGVVDRKYWVGMHYMLLYYSIGTPHDTNRTQTMFGESAQLVYDWSPKTVYIYIEDQKVTSYQN